MSQLPQIQILERPSPNMAPGRRGWKPDIIVCHTTDGHFPGSVNWVMNPASQVSYHFMVSQSGEVFQCVDIKNTAWANGTSNSGTRNDNRHSRLDAVRGRAVNANLYTVSIGFEGRHVYTRGALSPRQLTAAAALIRHIRAEVFRIWADEISLDCDHIVDHMDIAPLWRPNCPGVKFPFDDIILMAQMTCLQSIPAFVPGHVPDTWAQDAWLWAIESLRMDGTRPRDNITRQEVMTLLHRLYGAFKAMSENQSLNCPEEPPCVTV